MPEVSLTLVERDAPDVEVIRVLQQLLARAESGELRGIGIVALFVGSECSVAYRGVRTPYVISGLVDELKDVVRQAGIPLDLDRQVIFTEDQ